jgi:NitT/TauT family transport system substrate-binding protein
MHHTFRNAGLIVLLAVVLGAFVLPGTASAAGPDVVRVGYVRNALGGVLFELADHMGYFADEGLSIDFLPFESPVSEVDPLVHGEIDVSVGAPTAALFNAIAEGKGPRIVAEVATDRPGFGMVPLLVRSDLVHNGRYKKLHDLKGMTIALNGAGSITESTLDQLLRSAGLKAKDVHIFLVGFEYTGAAFASKAIDAALLPEPAATQTIHQGLAVRIMGNDKFYPNQDLAVASFSAGFLARHSMSVRVMRAYLRAARVYSDAVSGGRLHGPHADAIVSTITDITTLKDRKLAAQVVPAAANPDGDVDAESIRKDVEYLSKQGEVRGSPSVDDIVEKSVAQEAESQLGPYQAADRADRSPSNAKSDPVASSSQGGGGGNGFQTGVVIGMVVLVGGLGLVVAHSLFVVK